MCSMNCYVQACGSMLWGYMSDRNGDSVSPLKDGTFHMVDMQTGDLISALLVQNRMRSQMSLKDFVVRG